LPFWAYYYPFLELHFSPNVVVVGAEAIEVAAAEEVMLEHLVDIVEVVIMAIVVDIEGTIDIMGTEIMAGVPILDLASVA